jgi:putative transposase
MLPAGCFTLFRDFTTDGFIWTLMVLEKKYLELLGKSLESHDARIVAYCLMSSHIHLVLQLGNDPLGSLTKKVHSPFANWINSERKGLGAILADRPKSVLVHSETHGMALIRYVHNNPVRAKIVERASESSWSSHRAYLGLESCPSWLATEAVLGSDEKEHETLRHELACFVDEGRLENRRPEFNGEVSKSLVKRVRKLMGGDVELSYPVLGPDDFVVSALKEQVVGHRDKQRMGTENFDFEALTNAVFEALGLNPAAARQRTRARNISRGRALAAWLWVERLGGSQVRAASGFGVSPAALTIMLSKLRCDGLTKEEEALLNNTLKLMTKTDGNNNLCDRTFSENVEPKVIVLKRQR